MPTGPIYDLKTWRAALPMLNPLADAITQCQNKPSIAGGENGTLGYGNNFPGYLDQAKADRVVKRFDHA
jgi:hypothetical protein